MTIRKEALVKRWVEAYSETFRPRLNRVRYSSTKYKGRWWDEIDIAAYNAVWGGETAAARLTKHLKPQNVTIYADSNLTRLQARYGLVRDEGGNVDILRRFWTSGELNDCAPSLVVYSDLVATADERNLEAAQMIHDKYIAPLRKQPPEPLVEILRSRKTYYWPSHGLTISRTIDLRLAVAWDCNQPLPNLQLAEHG